MTDPPGRKAPPAQIAKIATAGATGVFVFGLTAVMGWAQRPLGEPALVPAQPATTLPAPTTVAGPAPVAVAPTTTLVPLATTIVSAPAPAPVPPPPPAVGAAAPAGAAAGSRRRRVGAIAVRATRHFRAMGCRSTVVVESDGADCEQLAELAMIGIARLEACWSPFLPDSDVSRLNVAGGAPIAVRPAAVSLLQAMAEATVWTGGAYDPTVRSELAERPPWIDHVAIDVKAMVVQLGPGIQIDPAGIGKGLAADLVAAEAMVHGAAAVAIMIGGDGRVSSVDGRHRWEIEVAEPGGEIPVDRIEISDGAIATSGFCWTNLVDPFTGMRRDAGDVVQVSVLAGSGASAEALTKAVLIAAEPGIADRLDRQQVGVLTVHADGRLSANATWLLHRGPSRDAAAA